MPTIVVPLDESTLAEEALPWAAYLARAYDCSVKLLTVWDAGHHVLERVALHHRPVAGAVEGELRSYLRRVAQRADLAGVAVTEEVRSGHVQSELRDAVDELDVRLVALTTHGRGGLRRFTMGSIADSLIRTATRSALVVHPASSRPPVARILVPLDGSATAELALAEARDLAAALGAEIHLLRAVDLLGQIGMPWPAYGIDDAREQLTAWAEEYLGAVEHPGETHSVAEGRPLDVILDYADRHGCGFIVMGTHGRGGVRRLALGSTADAIMRAADRPVLLVRTQP